MSGRNPIHWLGSFPAKGKSCQVPSCQCDAVAVVASIMKAELVSFYMCGEHQTKAEDWLKESKRFEQPRELSMAPDWLPSITRKTRSSSRTPSSS